MLYFEVLNFKSTNFITITTNNYLQIIDYNKLLPSILHDLIL